MGLNPEHFAKLFLKAEDVLKFQKRNSHCRKILDQLISVRPAYFAHLFLQSSDFIKLANGNRLYSFFSNKPHDQFFSAAANILNYESLYVAYYSNMLKTLLSLPR